MAWSVLESQTLIRFAFTPWGVQRQWCQCQHRLSVARQGFQQRRIAALNGWQLKIASCLGLVQEMMILC